MWPIWARSVNDVQWSFSSCWICSLCQGKATSNIQSLTFCSIEIWKLATVLLSLVLSIIIIYNCLIFFQSRIFWNFWCSMPLSGLFSFSILKLKDLKISNTNGRDQCLIQNSFSTSTRKHSEAPVQLGFYKFPRVSKILKTSTVEICLELH